MRRRLTLLPLLLLLAACGVGTAVEVRRGDNPRVLPRHKIDAQSGQLRDAFARGQNLWAFRCGLISTRDLLYFEARSMHFYIDQPERVYGPDDACTAQVRWSTAAPNLPDERVYEDAPYRLKLVAGVDEAFAAMGVDGPAGGAPEDQIMATAAQATLRNLWAFRCGYLNSAGLMLTTAMDMIAVFREDGVPFNPDAPCAEGLTPPFLWRRGVRP